MDAIIIKGDASAADGIPGAESMDWCCISGAMALNSNARLDGRVAHCTLRSNLEQSPAQERHIVHQRVRVGETRTNIVALIGTC